MNAMIKLLAVTTAISVFPMAVIAEPTAKPATDKAAASPPAALSPTAPTPGAPKHYTLQSLFGTSDEAPGSFAAAIMNGTPWIEERYRFEDDSQSKIHRHAIASTLRSRVGYETGNFNNFKAGLEIQNVHDIGPDRFNDGLNGKTLYPGVSDPQTTSFRQAYLDYNAPYKTEVKAGRQLINLDNQRFVGQSDWRQLGNNFDALSFYNTYFKNATLFYAYVRQANRGFSDRSPLGTLVGDSHLFNGSYEFLPELKAVAYTYILDFQSKNPAISILSTSTSGMRFTGKHKTTEDLTLSYALEAANQTPYGYNTKHADSNYYLVEPSASAFGVTGTLGYAVQQGNGTVAFQTPINTNHSFNGWADKFTTVPLNGLQNRYATLVYKLPVGCEWIKGTTLTGTYRKFDSDVKNQDYGHEWDALISQTFFEHYSANFEIADYRASSSNTAFADTYKFYAFVGIKF